jgi:hypothetical protein
VVFLFDFASTFIKGVMPNLTKYLEIREGIAVDSNAAGGCMGDSSGPKTVRVYASLKFFLFIKLVV